MPQKSKIPSEYGVVELSLANVEGSSMMDAKDSGAKVTESGVAIERRTVFGSAVVLKKFMKYYKT